MARRWHPNPLLVTILGLVAVGACARPTSGSRLYVTSGFTDQVLVLDPASGRILDARSLDPRPGERHEPRGIAVAPTGRHWYATSSLGEPALWKFRTEGDRLVGRVGLPLRGAGRVAVDPEGSRAVVPDYWLGGLGAPSELAVVDLETLEILTVREVCPAPHHAAWDPQGSRIAVACSLSDEIVVLDDDASDVLARFPSVSSRAGRKEPRPGNPRSRPMNLAWSPDGLRIYVSLMRAGLVAAYTADGDVVWTAPIGGSPAWIDVTPRGDWVVVANRGEGTLGLVDASTGRARALSLPDAPHPHGVAISVDGTVAYVTYEGAGANAGGVVAVDLRSGEILWKTAAGAFTLGLALLP